MSIITLNYSAKKIVKPDPVAESDIEEVSSNDNQCSTESEIIIKPGSSSKYVEVDLSGTKAFSSISNGTTVSSDTTVILSINAFRSFQESQNTETSSILLRVYSSNGGDLENIYKIRRSHTNNVC